MFRGASLQYQWRRPVDKGVQNDPVFTGCDDGSVCQPLAVIFFCAIISDGTYQQRLQVQLQEDQPLHHR